MKVRIIVDSTANVADEIRSRLTVLPLTIRFGEEEYLDGVTITNKQFYEKLIESDVLPTTSQATPHAFTELFEKAVSEGDSVVAITIASKLSGTCQSARIAAESFPGRVFVVDSKSVAIGAGILAEYALKLVDRGMDAESIANALNEERENIRLIAMLDTLEYLRRGGRISKTAAFAGGILAIKPVVSLHDGEVVVLGKARGSRQGNNLLVKEIQASGGVNFEKPHLLGYTGLSDLLLKKYVDDSAALWVDHVKALRTTEIGSVVGVHVGPGAVAVAFFKSGNKM